MLKQKSLSPKVVTINLHLSFMITVMRLMAHFWLPLLLNNWWADCTKGQGGFLWYFWVHQSGVCKEGGRLLLLLSWERESHYRARFARLSKGVVFCGTFGCTSKGYLERETSLTLPEREGVTFGCISKGYAVMQWGKLILLCFRESYFTGLTLLAS